jgi:hypothetical protein
VADQLSALSGNEPAALTLLDVEMFYRHFNAQNKTAKKIDTFFDPDLWKVKVDPNDLSLLFRVYIRFLQKQASPESALHLSARFLAADTPDSGALELTRSSQFKVPFVRISFHLPTHSPWGRAELSQLFDLSHKEAANAHEVELPLSLKIVERIGGRLKIKSNFEDGNVLTLDFAAAEERKAEDKVNAKQYAQFNVAPPAPIRQSAPAEKSLEKIPEASAMSNATPPRTAPEDPDAPIKSARFRIRRPGEKE